ncbi:MAG: hypothetical protein NC924_02365 [Candidatus Omnitrophica bacterium]|nr:hypothetical protein [Candidatus Omnitrophota bacterium]
MTMDSDPIRNITPQTESVQHVRDISREREQKPKEAPEQKKKNAKRVPVIPVEVYSSRDTKKQQLTGGSEGQRVDVQA